MEAAAGSGSGSAAAAARGRRGLLPCGHPRPPFAAPPPPRSSSAPPRRRHDWNPREQKAADAFTGAILDCVHAYMALTEEDIREEYRRAGKLDRYDDPANDELGKRIARVIKKYPPPPGVFGDDPDRYLKLLEDDDED